MGKSWKKEEGKSIDMEDDQHQRAILKDVQIRYLMIQRPHDTRIRVYDFN